MGCKVASRRIFMISRPAVAVSGGLEMGRKRKEREAKKEKQGKKRVKKEKKGKKRKKTEKK